MEKLLGSLIDQHHRNFDESVNNRPTANGDHPVPLITEYTNSKDLSTKKSVVGYGKNEIKYYDQKVFEIEKSHLIELIGNQKRKSLSDSVMTYDSSRLSEISPFFFNDKRLYEICQDSLLVKSRFQCRFITLAVPLYLRNRLKLCFGSLI